MSDLAGFLAARLDDDQAAAKLAAREGGTWTQPDPVREAGRIESLGGIVVYDEGTPDEFQAAHIVRWDPTRVLREADAKRKILAEYQDDMAKYGYSNALERALCALAAVWCDHPDYDPAWAVT